MSRRNRKDVDDLLADLDNLGTEPPAKPARKSADKPSLSSSTSTDGLRKGPDDAQSLLDDLDSLVQSRTSASSRASLRKKSGTSGAATPTAPAPATPKTEMAPTSPSPAPAPAPTVFVPADKSPEPTLSASSSGGGWAGWGSSLFTQATKLADQARQEFEKRAPTQAEQARELGSQIGSKGWDLAKNVRGFVAEANLEKWSEEVTKVGKRGWTDIINTVAPPISAHEIIQVTLSHDMVGYDGISDVTYQTLAKVMEQVESAGTGQQLVVNKARTETPAAMPKGGEGERELNAVEGFAAAFKLARVNLEECIKQHEVTPPVKETKESAALPITTCPVFVRIQACLAGLPGADDAEGEDKEKSLFFLVLLRDPQHGLSHKTVSQAVPTSWLDVAFEENEWVEESLVDVLSNALTIVGQDYVQGRMSGRTKSSKEGVVDLANEDKAGETTS
ncbi:Maintenance of telomere capping protein 1, Mtc1 [Kalmanozyma brasiliensis GHG001]|uniref:Maintenance of telomere capping protein 1 n=1 Tax=Kalmanozyma brasiliensis (strain GHG001) TaxID=1365824 RepID=V5GNT6_KALBG|nr:Maintenance of telomere capping protein 1, Mtc1 [Kalmanozyma brasiliensis GHG001]EST07617.1 Maintenance of telomere capping protein 1, Mtc1 [Kalmanozyma brasiliensis GHG001]